MINPRISIKPITAFSYTPRVQEVHTKAEVLHLNPGLLGLGYNSIVTYRKCIAKHMINPRISADWSTTKPIAAFSCTPRVKEVHIKADVVHLNPCLLGLGYNSIVTHRKCIAKHMINPRISADWSTTKPIAAFSRTPRVQEVHNKAEVVNLTNVLLGLGVLYNCHA